MSVRIYVYRDTDEKLEKLVKRLDLKKSMVVDMAVNALYRRIMKEEK